MFHLGSSLARARKAHTNTDEVPEIVGDLLCSISDHEAVVLPDVLVQRAVSVLLYGNGINKSVCLQHAGIPTPL